MVRAPWCVPLVSKLVTGISTGSADRTVRFPRARLRRQAEGALHQHVGQGHSHDALVPGRYDQRRHGRHL